MVEITNGELKVLSNQIGALARDVEKIVNKQDNYHEEAVAFRSSFSTSVALLEQSNQSICKDIDSQSDDIKELEERLNKQNTINKIFGGLGGLIALILAALGIRQ
jgi:ABC-type antimicrobial peptide transport system permease subunit